MRGNLFAARVSVCCGRSIPAYAGEPLYPTPSVGKAKVYPRVCGGTRISGKPGGATVGLSPRMRGNPAGDADDIAADRSIPAYAGEPRPAGAIIEAGTVYPRVCGGTGGCCALS